MDWIKNITSEHISLASVLFTVITFAVAFAYCKLNSIKVNLQELMVRSLSASAIPTAFVILVCSVELSLIQKLGGLLQVYIALAGLSLAYVSFSALFSPFNNSSNQEDNDDE